MISSSQLNTSKWFMAKSVTYHCLEPPKSSQSLKVQQQKKSFILIRKPSWKRMRLKASTKTVLLISKRSKQLELPILPERRFPVWEPAPLSQDQSLAPISNNNFRSLPSKRVHPVPLNPRSSMTVRFWLIGTPPMIQRILRTGRLVKKPLFSSRFSSTLLACTWVPPSIRLVFQV